MLFNPDPRKQATEVYFSKKQSQDSPLQLEFNDNTVQIVELHEHFGLSLDKKLDFNIHIDNKINNCNKIIDIIQRLSLNISRDSLRNMLLEITFFLQNSTQPFSSLLDSLHKFCQ